MEAETGCALKKNAPFRSRQQAGTAYVIVIGPGSTGGLLAGADRGGPPYRARFIA